jgi:UDP-GlcNAc:undecaprenyl-phosphate GlcNAc-1-phosphate transferase
MGNPLGGLISLDFWSIPLTLLWVVGLTNAINFIDGLDGLAAGVSGIAAISLFAFAWQTGQTEIATFSIALAGGTFGFLRHNFYPAQIFMGDSGSMFLGFMIGAITVAGVMKSIVAVALLIPIVIMGVPLLDVVSSVFRRVRKGKPAMQADKSHIHHKLLRKGFSHPQTVSIIYVWCIVLSVTAFAIELAPQSLRLVVFVVLGLTSLWLARFLGLLEH